MGGGAVSEILGISTGDTLSVVLGSISLVSPYIAERMEEVFLRQTQTYPISILLDHEQQRMRQESETTSKRAEQAVGPFTSADTSYIDELNAEAIAKGRYENYLMEKDNKR